MILEPPPAGTTVAIDAGQAYRIAQGRGHCGLERGPSITLAVATTDLPARIEADGSHTRLIDNRLVQVLRWDDITWSPSGPALGPGQRRTRREAHGTQWMFVDARTGEIVRHLLTGISN